jgi:hypothetical protein
MSDAGTEKQEDSTTLFAEGEAGLWLSESIVLALLEANILDAETILEAMEIVIQAKKAKADAGCNPVVSRAAAAQLASISASIAAAKRSTNRNGRTRRRHGVQKNST